MRVVGVRDVLGIVGDTKVRPLRPTGATVGLGVGVAAAAGADGCSGAFD